MTAILHDEIRTTLAKFGDRSWALSVVLARINDEEMTQLLRSLDLPDIQRFRRVVVGYKDDVAKRDAKVNA